MEKRHRSDKEVCMCECNFVYLRDRNIFKLLGLRLIFNQLSYSNSENNKENDMFKFLIMLFYLLRYIIKTFKPFLLSDGFPTPMQRPHWLPTQDHHSTLSRPRSSEVFHTSNGSIPNGRTLNGLVTRTPGGLYEDLEFPPTPRTLSRKKNIVWMRPHVSMQR